MAAISCHLAALVKHHKGHEPARIQGASMPTLPLEHAPLIGRDSEAAALWADLARGERLLTLFGGPGLGKTRLAVHIARRALAAGRTVVFCDLSDARSGDVLPAAMARALGLPLLDDAPLLQVGDALGERGNVCVVLDNAEPLVEACAEALRVWLERAPEAQWIVTSREPLRIADEQVLELLPLPRAAAIELWRARGGTGDDAVIGELVERLDAIPLAIELGAARAASMSAAELLARLPERLELLRGTRRDLPPRHLTMRAAIDASWQLLPPAARDALVQLALFESAFSLAAAEAVVELAGPVVDALETLRQRALLLRADGAFRLLECIRSFAGEALAGRDDREAVERRHAAFHLERAEALAAAARGREGAGRLRELDALTPELLAVQRRWLPRAPDLGVRATLALAPALSRLGPTGLWVSLLTAASEALDRRTPAALAARLWVARATALLTVGRTAEARRDAERALAALLPGAGPAAPDAAAIEVDVHRLLARLDRHDGRGADALAHLEAARARTVDPWQLAGIDAQTATLAAERGALDEAMSGFARARAGFHALGDASQEADALDGLGFVESERGRSAEARTHQLAALEAHRAANDVFSQGYTLQHLGVVHHHLGDFEAARAALESARSLHARIGATLLEPGCLIVLGWVEAEAGNLERAAFHLEHGLAALGARGKRRLTALAMGYRAVVHHLAREAGAPALLDEAVRIAGEAGDSRTTCMFEAYRAALLAAAGDSAGTARALERAAAMVEPRDTLLAALVEVSRGHSDLCASPPDATRARARTVAARASAFASCDLRMACVLVEHALGQVPAPAASAPPAELVVGREARWFRVAGQSAVHLTRHRSLRLALLALVDRRLSAPGQALDTDALRSAAWPGERMQPEAGQRRVYSTIHSLRRLGLGAVLTTRDDGYLIPVAIPVRFGDEA